MGLKSQGKKNVAAEKIVALLSNPEQEQERWTLGKFVEVLGAPYSTVQRAADGLVKDKILETNRKTGYQLTAEGENREHLRDLKELFTKVEDTPNFHKNIGVAVLQILNDDNQKLARQIWQTFDEVVCAYCPDDVNVVVFYKRRKKKPEARQEPSPENAEPAESEKLADKNDNSYAEDDMLTTLTKLCREKKKQKREQAGK